MHTESGQKPDKPMAKIRFVILVLVLTLAAFGIIGALVALLPQARKVPILEEKQAPQVHRLDRETLRKGAPAPGS